MVMTSNIPELTNVANKDIRDMPIINLSEFMRMMIIKWDGENRKCCK